MSEAGGDREAEVVPDWVQEARAIVNAWQEQRTTQLATKDAKTLTDRIARGLEAAAKQGRQRCTQATGQPS